MKVLEINNNHGWYVLNGQSNPIIDINKDDILKLLDVLYSNEKIIMDSIDDGHSILNEAEKVIYENIYKYFIEFNNKKSTLKSEIENEFSEITKLIENDENQEE